MSIRHKIQSPKVSFYVAENVFKGSVICELSQNNVFFEDFTCLIVAETLSFQYLLISICPSVTKVFIIVRKMFFLSSKARESSIKILLFARRQAMFILPRFLTENCNARTSNSIRSFFFVGMFEFILFNVTWIVWLLLVNLVRYQNW